MHNEQVNINDENSCIKGKDQVINHTCVNQLYSLQTISCIFDIQRKITLVAKTLLK